MKPIAWLVLASIVCVPLAGIAVVGAIVWRQQRVDGAAASLVGKEKPSLTSEQRNTWNELRRKNKDSAWTIAFMNVGQKTWHIYCFIGANPGRGFASQRDAEEIAKDTASEPDTKMVVVIDLFSHEDPIVCSWYYDAGNGVEKRPEAPSATEREALQAALDRVQQKLRGPE